MARVSIAGVDNFDLGGLDDDLFFAVYATLTLPGFSGVETTRIGTGLTRLFFEFGDQQLGAIIENYQGNAMNGVTGGTIRSVLVYSESDTAQGEAVWAEDLDIGVDALTAAVAKAGNQGHFGPVAKLIWDQDWRIIGDGQANTFLFEDEVGTYGPVGVFTGDDTILGKGGDDLIALYDGDDTGKGGSGDDVVQGGKGRDRLSGDRGFDKLEGGGGNDRLDGGRNGDTLEGGNGADLLIGGHGQDRLKGGSGADTLEGGAGDDRYTGGGGADRFVFSADDGGDVITDFDPARDVIKLSGVDGIAIREISGGVRIRHEGGTIELRGVTLDDISQDDILGW